MSYFLLLFFSINGISSEPPCEELFSRHTSEETTDFPHIKKLIYVDPKFPANRGHLTYTISDGLLIVHEMESGLKQTGLQTKLFREALTRNPNINRIRFEGLADDNLKIFTDHFLTLLKNHPKAILVKQKLSPPDFFLKCCSDLSQKEKQRMVNESLEKTPAFKIAKKQNFTKICPDEQGTLFEIIPHIPNFITGFDVCP